MKEIKQYFEKALMADWKNKRNPPNLHAAIQYALQSGGKRIRPIICMSIADAIGRHFDVLPASLSVEYFHTASLIADDLPCMDDDNVRRGKPSLHCQFNETTALLSSYALICAAFEKLHDNTQILAGHISVRASEVGMLALKQAAQAAGIEGATGGQYLDLFPLNKDLDTLMDTFNRKTVTLFETAFVLGWLFGGGDPMQIDSVKNVAQHFGLAFQIGDDLVDMDGDDSSANIALALGVENATQQFNNHMEQYSQGLEDLGIACPNLKSLGQMLIDHVTVIEQSNL